MHCDGYDWSLDRGRTPPDNLMLQTVRYYKLFIDGVNYSIPM